MIKLGLRFEDAYDERRFVRQFTLDDLGRTQGAMVLGAFVYCAFGVWDWILDPTHWTTTFAIRLTVTTVALLPLTAVLSNVRAQTHAEIIYLAYCIIPGCVLSFIYLLLVSGFNHAAAGTIIVILFVSTLLPLRVLSLLAFCVSTWICFAVCQSMSVDDRAGLHFVNNFEIGMSYALALYAVGAREIRARHQFQTTRALQREKERSEAALTDLTNAQTHLVQAEKLASLGQLVAGVAHEVNTPIGLALTTSTALEADIKHFARIVKTGQIRRSDLTQIIGHLEEGTRLLFSNLTRAADLVQNFKQVAIDQTNEARRTFELQSWLQELMSTLGPLLRRKGHEVSISCEPGIMLDSYPGSLAQVISNLALNAIIHGFADGRAGKLELSAARVADDKLRIVFSDNGDGISDENLSKVFDPFFTTRRGEGSTGLGLHIVFNLVSATLNGEIEMKSSVDQGTEFIIYLPI
ncbi:hypothetical protein MGN01_39930 [Methylobacterium gnaphalii]|uniref:histidine kinase n=1 Tax=Methylobacterium gnaphalii TaxID=1010610 RepID=A0A512JQB8_9HYPH|nr:hypothetical protein MGN01_39930 [Methylobacterium gnaphalii]GLS48907.1 hypothetical protein GCM10007885_17540 [Methylobacterium gnaphalii]